MQSELKGWFRNLGERASIDDKDYQFVYVVFPFGTAVICRAKGFVLDVILTFVYVMYSELFLNLLRIGTMKMGFVRRC